MLPVYQEPLPPYCCWPPCTKSQTEWMWHPCSMFSNYSASWFIYHISTRQYPVPITPPTIYSSSFPPHPSTVPTAPLHCTHRTPPLYPPHPSTVPTAPLHCTHRTPPLHPPHPSTVPTAPLHCTHRTPPLYPSHPSTVPTAPLAPYHRTSRTVPLYHAHRTHVPDGSKSICFEFR